MGNEEELVQIAAGSFGKVLMTPKVWKEFQELDARTRAVIGRLMEIYADRGPDDLNSKSQFPHEGSHSVGNIKGTKVSIHAFKAYETRVYGGFVSSLKAFVCGEIDVAKKRQKANPGKLARAAKNLAKYIEP